MGDKALKGNKLTRKRKRFSRGGGSAPFLRGRSGADNIKAPRGEGGWKDMQKAEGKIGRLTVGKKSHIDTSAKQKIEAQNRKDAARNKKASEEWKEVDKIMNIAKKGAKIIGGGTAAIIGSGAVKKKLKKKDEE